ncbi:MAG TPA: cyclic pyranopterin monophosphate synthase MoaC [Kiritimatiellia bacterium]|nr:cyclic pyranopterin monophosphate synthase MoaC [Kiritimatiellia bacterium]
MKKNTSILSHVNAQGRPAMVDISGKNVTLRTAEAEAIVALPPEVYQQLKKGDLQTAKGPVFHTAIIAGTQAVKETSRLIPFCHPLPIQKCDISVKPAGKTISIRCRVSAEYKTGVEMEALTGACAAALTIYDMCKALSHDMVIKEIRLIRKTGGKTDIGQ